MSHGRGESDRGVVPKKLPNKAADEAPAAAEVVEGRLRAKGNAVQQRMSRRSMRVYDVQTALDGIRQTARGRPGAKFTTLMHHIYQVERLRAAYMACKRDAAAGVDGQTWAGYGQDLEVRLLDLSDRLARGGYLTSLREVSGPPLRDHGVVAPSAKLRSLVVPKESDQAGQSLESAATAECETEAAQVRPGRISWARLPKRVFDIDMEHCPNCGGAELEIIAAILERPAIEKILTYLGLDPQPPPRGRARQAGQDFAP